MARHRAGSKVWETGTGTSLTSLSLAFAARDVRVRRDSAHGGVVMAKLGWKATAGIVAGIAVLALVAGAWFAGWWPFADATPEPTPTPTPTASPSPSATATPPPVFVPRQVTVAPHVPDSELLSAEVLESAGSGWVVAIHDATAVNDLGVEAPGPRVLYLISPEGTRYELGNLDVLGFGAPDVVAWDYERDKILLVDNLAQAKVVSMVNGAVEGSWELCPREGYVRGSSKDGAWLLRGSCEGEGIDGLYSDAGVEISDSIVGKGFGFTVFDIGDVQVQSEFETAPDVRFVAFYPDGTEAIIPSEAQGDCYMIGKGAGETFVAYCYATTGDTTLDVWEFPVDGSEPANVITAAQLEAFRVDLGVPSPADYFVTGYCAASDVRVVEVTWDQRRLGVPRDGSLEAVSQPPYALRHCHATSGTSALVSGDGFLWLTDFEEGAAIELLPGSAADAAEHVVGAEGYRALMQP